MSMLPSKLLDSIMTKDFLLREYVENRKSCVRIAKEIGICSNVAVKNRLIRYEIPIFSKWHERIANKQKYLENQQLKYKGMSFLVKCEICGIEKQHIVAHLNRTHNISTFEYKKLFPNAKICSEVFSAKKRETQVGRKLSKETKEKHSLISSRKMMEEYSGKYITTRKSNYKVGKMIVAGIEQYYRSSYEEMGLIFLDKVSGQFNNLLNESFRVPYISEEGIKLHTIPDWLIELKSGETYLVEVKCNWKLRNKKVQAKMLAALNWAVERNIKYCVWTEDILFDLSSTTMSLKEILEATVTDHTMPNCFGRRYSLNSIVI